MQFRQLKRREFISIIGGATVAWPIAVRGQQLPEVPRIGFIYPGSQAAAASRIEAILSGLRVSGFAAPAQVEIVARSANGDPTQIVPLVKDVISKNVNVLIANGPPILHAARPMTHTLPIVAIDLETDQIASGVAATLSRPGGNITGVFLDFPDFTGKWIQMLVEINPKLSHATVLWDPVTGPMQVQSVKKAADTLHLEIDILEIKQPADFDAAFERARQGGAQAVVLLSSPLIAPNAQLLAELALRHRLPAITLFPDFARAGGLLAYGPNLLSLFRLVGIMTAKILRGTDPAELPIERPTKFETVLNVRTADALGISIPTSLLLRADEVIE